MVTCFDGLRRVCLYQCLLLPAGSASPAYKMNAWDFGDDEEDLVRMMFPCAFYVFILPNRVKYACPRQIWAKDEVEAFVVAKIIGSEPNGDLVVKKRDEISLSSIPIRLTPS